MFSFGRSGPSPKIARSNSVLVEMAPKRKAADLDSAPTPKAKAKAAAKVAAAAKAKAKMAAAKTSMPKRNPKAKAKNPRNQASVDERLPTEVNIAAKNYWDRFRADLPRASGLA